MGISKRQAEQTSIQKRSKKLGWGISTTEELGCLIKRGSLALPQSLFQRL